MWHNDSWSSSTDDHYHKNRRNYHQGYRRKPKKSFRTPRLFNLATLARVNPRRKDAWELLLPAEAPPYQGIEKPLPMPPRKKLGKKYKQAIEARVNLNSLRHQDPEVVEILDHAVSVALYMWDVENNSWTKPEMEGTLFVYSRRVAPFAGFTIMNRLSINNLSEKITNNMNVHIKAPFLLYQSGDTRTVPRGIWFYNQYDCIRITKLIQKYIGVKEPVSNAMSVEPVFEPISTESSEDKDSLASCKEDLMLIMGKSSKSTTPKTKPSDFKMTNSRKSPHSPKNVPIPPLTPGKKVDLNLLFSSNFTPIKPATPVQNLESSIEHPYPSTFPGGPQTPIDKRKTDALKSMIGIHHGSAQQGATSSSFMSPSSMSQFSGISKASSRSQDVFSFEVLQNQNSSAQNASQVTAVRSDLLRTPPPMKGTGSLSGQKSEDTDDSSEFNQPMSFAVIESGDDVNVSPSSRLSPPSRNMSFNTVPRNLFGREGSNPTTLLSPGAFASIASDGRSSISSSQEGDMLVPSVKVRNGPLFKPQTAAGNNTQAPPAPLHQSTQFERDVMKRTLIKLIEEDKEFMNSFHAAYMRHMAQLRS